MGDLVKYECSPEPESSDWFNVRIDEIGEIAAYLKSGIKRFPPYASGLNLDFLLHTADGDSLPLETWVVRIDPTNTDENVNVHTHLYHQMSTLLKSIQTAARVTPTYRYYARKQSPETFVIFYRVFEGEPDLFLLGDDQRYVRLGSLPSPFGSLCVDLYYRTRMEIVPNANVSPIIEAKENVQSQNENVVFRLGSIPFGSAVPAKGSEIVAASPVSEEINTFSTSPLSQDLPFGNQSEQEAHFKLGRSVSSSDDSANPRLAQDNKSDDPTFAMDMSNSPKGSSSFPQRSSSYRQIRVRNNSFPFASLLLESQTAESTRSQVLPRVVEDTGNGASLLPSNKSDSALNRSSNKSLHVTSSSPLELFAQMSIKEEDEEKQTLADESEKTEVDLNDNIEGEDGMESSDDSYVKVFAFASTDDLGNDLGEFVKEVRQAPQNLPSFSQDNANLLADQLSCFKEKVGAFDSFVAGLKEKEDE
uniref:Autophagy-related protein 13 n=1 Tax=Acrobeloides nanus TaxID=290746 RepID=A0A914C2G9_9BILA